MERLRIRFSRGQELKYISHLDLIRLWERALRRAGMPLAYTEGFSPHPHISLAAPLSLGVTSHAELMDISFTRRLVSSSLIKAMGRQLPDGIAIFEVQWIAPGVPSLQSQVHAAEYLVEVETEKDAEQVQEAIEGLLQAEHLPWQHMRDTGVKSYDLRPLVYDVALKEVKASLCTLVMKLRCDSSGTGRPEQVSLALGFSQRPRSIRRTGLFLAQQ